MQELEQDSQGWDIHQYDGRPHYIDPSGSELDGESSQAEVNAVECFKYFSCFPVCSIPLMPQIWRW